MFTIYDYASFLYAFISLTVQLILFAHAALGARSFSVTSP